MTKNIIFIIAALCSLQARADVQPTERDTVHRTYRYDDTELLQPLQPLYLDGVVALEEHSSTATLFEHNFSAAFPIFNRPYFADAQYRNYKILPKFLACFSLKGNL